MKWIVLGLIGIVILSGCTNINYYPTGIIEHDDSLQEALSECRSLCEKEYPYKISKITPKVDECTEKECQCLC